MKSRVAPTPIGTVFTIGWPNCRDSHDAACMPVSGYSTMLNDGIAKPGQIGRRGTQRGDHIDRHAEAIQQANHLGDIVAMPEPQRRRAQDIAARLAHSVRLRTAKARTSW